MASRINRSPHVRRVTRQLLALVCALVFGFFGWSAVVRAQSGPPEKDPNAVSILNRAANAMGANFAQHAADSKATGALTIYASDGTTTSGSITLYTLGDDRFRTEIVDGVSTRSVTVNAGEAWFEVNGQAKELSGNTALDIRPEHLPQLSKIRSSGRGDIGARMIGTQTVDGFSVSVIELADESEGQHREKSSHSGKAPQLEGNVYRIYIDTTSFLIRRVAFTRGAEGNPTARSTVENLYSDFRQVGQAMVPFQVERRASGETVSTIRLSQFQFDAGVPADKFAKPSFAQSGGGR